MTKSNKQLGYSSIIFYSFAISFFVLSVVNIFCPISNFKMTVLSVVALLFSLQQLYEANEEVDKKISDLEKKTVHQGSLLDLMDSSSETQPPMEESSTEAFTKSRWVFAMAMIILIVGLTLDFNLQSGGIANTLTIVSFAVIFFTMGYKERFSARIELLNEELYAIDQRIISKLEEQINSLQRL